MAKLIYVECDQVKIASAEFERLLAKDPRGKIEIEERERRDKEEKARRDREFAVTQPMVDQSERG